MTQKMAFEKIVGKGENAGAFFPFHKVFYPDLLCISGYQIEQNNRYATKILRQKSSTKFYNLINQNTVISNKIKI